MENWLDEFNGSSLTPEEQQSFKSAMGKYKSKDEALIGGYNAIKLTGKPYKLPESIDKLPKEVQEEFKSGAMKVLGIEPGVDDDSVKKVNFKKGLTGEANETVVAKLTEFAKKEGIGLTKLQNLVEFVNTFGTEQVSAFEAERQAAIKKAVETTGQELDRYYGAEERKNKAELLRKAVQNDCGLSSEEVEQLAEDLAEDGYIFRKPALARILIDHVAPLAKEGTTETHDVDKTKTEGERSLADEGFTKTAKLIGLK